MNKTKPELSSQQRPDKKVMVHQSSAPDVGASRERSRENLTGKTKKNLFRIIVGFSKSQSSPLILPMACDVSTTGTLDTGVSWQKSWSVMSVVDVDVKPFNRSCCSPVKLLQFNWLWRFSSFSRYSCLSSDMLASSLFSSLRDIWYSNSKSDSINDTATQKMVASRLLGWFMLIGSFLLSLDEEERRILANWTCCSQAWMRSRVALRGRSELLSASPNFFGTEELLWCLLCSSLRGPSCPVIFLFNLCLKLVRKSGEDSL